MYVCVCIHEYGLIHASGDSPCLLSSLRQGLFVVCFQTARAQLSGCWVSMDSPVPTPHLAGGTLGLQIPSGIALPCLAFTSVLGIWTGVDILISSFGFNSPAVSIRMYSSEKQKHTSPLTASRVERGQQKFEFDYSFPRTGNSPPWPPPVLFTYV